MVCKNPPKKESKSKTLEVVSVKHIRGRGSNGECYRVEKMQTRGVLFPQTLFFVKICRTLDNGEIVEFADMKSSRVFRNMKDVNKFIEKRTREAMREYSPATKFNNNTL